MRGISGRLKTKVRAGAGVLYMSGYVSPVLASQTRLDPDVVLDTGREQVDHDNPAQAFDAAEAVWLPGDSGDHFVGQVGRRLQHYCQLVWPEFRSAGPRNPSAIRGASLRARDLGWTRRPRIRDRAAHWAHGRQVLHPWRP